MPTRIVYYIIQCTSEENQNGIFHYSKPFKNEAFVINATKKVRNDFVVIEKHHEVYDNYEWRPNFDMENWNTIIESPPPQK